MWYAVQDDEEKTESLLVSFWRDGTDGLTPTVADPHTVQVMVPVSDRSPTLVFSLRSCATEP